MADKIKRKDADTEAAEYMELQMKLSDKSKASNIVLIILTLGFIFAFAILFWVMPDNDFSAEENRTLQKAPEMTFENLFSGNLTDEFSDYMADQFPFRNFFVGVKGVVETAQVKLQNNSVILGKDGYLIARNDYPDEKNLKTNISSIGNFIKAAEEKGIECHPAFAGRKQDVLEQKIPEVYGMEASDRIWKILDEDCRAAGFDYLNLRDAFRQLESTDPTVYGDLYYRNDHHWNSLGAYYAYALLVSELGETPYALTDFEKEVASEDFFGTTWSSAGIKWVKGDELDYYRWGKADDDLMSADRNFTMKILEPSKRFEGYEGCHYIEEDGKTYAFFEDGYFVREFLNEKDKYASFIGGNFGYTEITQKRSDREIILILKDSFSHSMVQFLARHYNLIMIDLRYYSSSIMKLCEEKGINKVIFLYNMETLTEGPYLKILNSGLK